MNNHLAYGKDPDTSKLAAALQRPDKTARVMAAILELLAEKPRAAFELRDSYFSLREANGWPIVQPHSIARRLSQLHMQGRVKENGDRVKTPDHATAARWEILK